MVLMNLSTKQKSSHRCREQTYGYQVWGVGWIGRLELPYIHIDNAYMCHTYTLQEESLPAEPQREPKNTGVGSLSFLQQVFLTQESNQSLLHWRCILYQLNYEGSPHIYTDAAAKSLQSCPTLCDPMYGSPPGSPVPGDSPGKNTGVGCHSVTSDS